MVYWYSSKPECPSCDDVEQHVAILHHARMLFWVCKWRNGIANAMKEWWYRHLRRTWVRTIEIIACCGCCCFDTDQPRVINCDMIDRAIPEDAIVLGDSPNVQ